MLHLQIITPEKTVFDDEVSQVSLPTEDGRITILPHHTALMTSIVPGELNFKTHSRETTLASGFGFAQVAANQIKVLVDLAAPEEEIEEKRVEEAKRAAEEALKNKHTLSEEEYALAAANLQKALIQLKIKHKRRRV